MSLLEQFNLVYGADWRVLDPSIEVDAATGLSPQPQLEVGHAVRWVGKFSGADSVTADGQKIAFRGHKTETMLPHVPLSPPYIGVQLAKTIVVDSKCHIYCYNPDVEIEGKQVGIAMVLLAPPFHCASIQLPAGLDKLAQALDKIPGLTKLKGALGGLHKLNEKFAKLDALGKNAQKVLEGARMGQILGSAGVEAFRALQELWDDEEEASGTDPDPEPHPFHASQDALIADADYKNAGRARSGKPGAEYYQLAQEADGLDCEIQGRGLDERRMLDEQIQAYQELKLLEHEGAKIDGRMEAHEERQKALRHRITRLSRRARLGEPVHGTQDLHAEFARAKEFADDLRTQQNARACARSKIQERIDHLGRALEKSGRQSREDRKRLDQLRESQARSLAQMPSAPSHKQLAVMLPSLTSFSVTFWLHSVKIGMSPASFWRMQLRVLAIVVADLIDYGIGLVGDALLVDGPTSRVGSWVAELGSGAMQGMVGSALRTWGTQDRLDFSVPIRTGSLLAGGLVQARAEFYWAPPKSDKSSEGSIKEEEATLERELLGRRIGVDAPGRSLDIVSVHQGEHAPGIDFEIPPIW